MATIILVFGCFALAALGGLFLAVRHFRGQSFPWPVTILHGLLAASGLALLLLIYFDSEANTTLTVAVILLVCAALGGFFLVSFHLRSRKPPTGVLVAHALAAVAGVVTIVLAML